MLSIEIKVNGNPVGVVEAYRGPGFEGSDVHDYSYRAVFFPLDMAEKPKVKTGSVIHGFSEGMAVLCERIMKDINSDTY